MEKEVVKMEVEKTFVYVLVYESVDPDKTEHSVEVYASKEDAQKSLLDSYNKECESLDLEVWDEQMYYPSGECAEIYESCNWDNYHKYWEIFRKEVIGA